LDNDVSAINQKQDYKFKIFICLNGLPQQPRPSSPLETAVIISSEFLADGGFHETGEGVGIYPNAMAINYTWAHMEQRPSLSVSWHKASAF
jgi:hypothetical protein